MLPVHIQAPEPEQPPGPQARRFLLRLCALYASEAGTLAKLAEKAGLSPDQVEYLASGRYSSHVPARVVTAILKAAGPSCVVKPHHFRPDLWTPEAILPN